MGWDAFAMQRGKHLERDWPMRRIKKRRFRRAFTKASERTHDRTGQVDWMLQIGGLDCSPCAEALEAATGMDAWGDDLTVRQIQQYATGARWDFEENFEPWAYWSAREFLETCARLRLGMHFSW